MHLLIAIRGSNTNSTLASVRDWCNSVAAVQTSSATYYAKSYNTSLEAAPSVKPSVQMVTMEHFSNPDQVALITGDSQSTLIAPRDALDIVQRLNHYVERQTFTLDMNTFTVTDSVFIRVSTIKIGQRSSVWVGVEVGDSSSSAAAPSSSAPSASNTGITAASGTSDKVAELLEGIRQFVERQKMEFTHLRSDTHVETLYARLLKHAST
jgi:hypothetical protein